MASKMSKQRAEQILEKVHEPIITFLRDEGFARVVEPFVKSGGKDEAAFLRALLYAMDIYPDCLYAIISAALDKPVSEVQRQKMSQIMIDTVNSLRVIVEMVDALQCKDQPRRGVWDRLKGAVQAKQGGAIIGKYSES